MVGPAGESHISNSKPSKRQGEKVDSWSVSDKAQKVIKVIHKTFKNNLSNAPTLKTAMIGFDEEKGLYIPLHDSRNQDECDEFIDKQFSNGNIIVTDLDFNSIYYYTGPKKRTNVNYYGISPPNRIKHLSPDKEKKVDAIIRECIRCLLKDEGNRSNFIFRMIYLIEGLGHYDILNRSVYLKQACLDVMDKT